MAAAGPRICAGAPFPTGIFKDDAPPLALQYNKWTPLTKNSSIPPEAEIDWVNGCALMTEEARSHSRDTHSGKWQVG